MPFLLQRTDQCAITPKLAEPTLFSDVVTLLMVPNRLVFLIQKQSNMDFPVKTWYTEIQGDDGDYDAYERKCKKKKGG